MGSMVKFSCTNCGYDVEFFLGEGMFSSMQNHNNQSKYIVAAKNGSLGKDIQKIVNENADVYIAKAPAIAICSKCGAFEQTKDFMVYVNHRYAEREKHFKKCKKCGGDAEIFDEGSIGDAILKNTVCPKCPKCHEEMVGNPFSGMWD